MNVYVCIYIYIRRVVFVRDLLNEKWTDLHAKVYKFITFEVNDVVYSSMFCHDKFKKFKDIFTLDFLI